MSGSGDRQWDSAEARTLRDTAVGCLLWVRLRGHRAVRELSLWHRHHIEAHPEGWLVPHLPQDPRLEVCSPCPTEASERPAGLNLELMR